MALKPYPKQLLRQNRAIVRELFMREWDPIGVSDAPEAQDEYDSYSSKAYVMVMHDGASIEQVADYLYTIETEYMGLSGSVEAKDRVRKVAASLIAMKPSLQASRNALNGDAPLGEAEKSSRAG